MRLSALQNRIADALGEPPGEVRTRIEALREAKLITTGPRGPGAPHMTARDLATLILACAAYGPTTQSDRTVAKVAAAEIVGLDARHGDEEKHWSVHQRPTSPFRDFILPDALEHLGPHTALDALERLIAVFEGAGSTAIEGLSVEVEAYGYIVEIDLSDELASWTLTYVKHEQTGRGIVRRGAINGGIICDLAREVMEHWR